jgi:hypothetical protein
VRIRPLMKSLGTIVEILSRDAVLVHSEHQMSTRRVVAVFARVSTPQLKQKYKVDFLDFKKGELVVSSRQGNLYVCTVYQPSIERRRNLSPGVLSALLGSEVLSEEVPGPPSVSLAATTLPMKVSEKVEVGDHIGDE